MTRTILSVADYELKCDRPLAVAPNGPFSHTFIIPPAAKGEYKLLRVDDMFSQYYMMEGNWNNGIPERADSIVADLVMTWTGNTTDPPPGVIVIKGDKPTQEEMDKALAMHNHRCEVLRTAAGDLWATGQRKLAAQDQYRRASVWLGCMTDPWVNTPKVTMQTPCPWCTKMIDAEAAVCPECGNIANFDKHQRLTEEMQRRLEAMQKAKQSVTAPPPVPPSQPLPPPVMNPQQARPQKGT